MTIHEFTNRVEVITPEGTGSIWFVTQLGHETPLLFCVLQDDGTIWEWQPKNIRVKDNRTFNRLNINNGKINQGQESEGST